jgi:hypothetical protein
MLKEILFLAIAGTALIHAQTPPPTPPFTMPPRESALGEPAINVSREQLQRLFTIRDQSLFYYALRNEGIITEDEFYSSYYGINLAEEKAIIDPIIGASMEELRIIDDAIGEALGKLWPGHFPPGWPRAQLMREILGLALQQPPGTRATTLSNNNSFSTYITPYTEQIYDNLKQQFEEGLGITLKLNPRFNFPNSIYEYSCLLLSRRSADGNPYQILLTRDSSSNFILLRVSEQVPLLR